LFQEEGVPDDGLPREDPPGPLPVLASEPSDVLLSQCTIESLEQENKWLKERLARIIRSQIAK
jgi:hypothetical protein